MNDEFKNPPRFIVPAFLDDAGLTPAQFRVLARIARRAGKDGTCFESLDSMAAGCKLRRATIQNALKDLEAGDWIIKESPPGKTCVYKLTQYAISGRKRHAPEEWVSTHAPVRRKPIKSA